MKRIVIILISLWCSYLYAQNISVTVNNPYAGWLSSQLNPTEIPYIWNLKVEGKINSSDITTICRLMNEYNLHGKLDLTDADMVAEKSYADNFIDGEMFSFESGKGYISYLALPASLENAKMSVKKWERIDTLEVGGVDAIINKGMYNWWDVDKYSNYASTQKVIQVLKIREGTKIIGEHAFYVERSLCEVILPDNLERIEHQAFAECYNLEKINWPKGLKILSYHTFLNTKIYLTSFGIVNGDTLNIPEGTERFALWPSSSGNFNGMGGQIKHIYVPKSIEGIDFSNIPSGSLNVSFHFFTPYPPSVYQYDKIRTTHFIDLLEKCTIYIPKGSRKNYLSSLWSDCSIIEVPFLESLSLDKNSLQLNVGDTESLKATPYPSDAADKEYTFVSDNNDVATVDADGNVTAVSSGKTKIWVVAKENNDIKDYCEVTVNQPVTGLTLDYTEYTLNDIGSSFTLTAEVQPETATNKEITWRSSDEKVCIVSNGLVVATGYGKAVVIATTKDGGYLAMCTVEVVNATGINDYSSDSLYTIYNENGIKQSSLRKGVNIIRLSDGSTRKVVVK